MNRDSVAVRGVPHPPMVASNSTRLCALYGELRRYQQRLGTQVEHAGDLERILEIAHEISNGLTIEYFLDACASPARPPQSMAQLVRRIIKDSTG